MGIIADSFKATLEAIKEQDEISQAETNSILRDINRLIDTLEAIDLED
jgi:hypothetical protein